MCVCVCVYVCVCVCACVCVGGGGAVPRVVPTVACPFYEMPPVEFQKMFSTVSLYNIILHFFSILELQFCFYLFQLSLSYKCSATMPDVGYGF